MATKKRDPIVPNPGAVQVDASKGEFLHFTVKAVGPVAIFAFASNVKGVLVEAADFLDHPTSLYEWVHLKNPSDIQQLELLNILFSFLTNAQYEYLVELKASDDSTIKKVLHVKYNDKPLQTASESFTVIIK